MKTLQPFSHPAFVTLTFPHGWLAGECDGVTRGKCTLHIAGATGSEWIFGGVWWNNLLYKVGRCFHLIISSLDFETCRCTSEDVISRGIYGSFCWCSVTNLVWGFLISFPLPFHWDNGVQGPFIHCIALVAVPIPLRNNVASNLYKNEERKRERKRHHETHAFGVRFLLETKLFSTKR